VFSSVNGVTIGTMKFADRSVVKIAGIGTMLYECKTGEHRALYNVYFIPHLTANIISIGKLDEDGYGIRIKDGVMVVRDENQKLLARISHSLGRYMLDQNTAHTVCLAICAEEDAWRWHSRFGHVNFTTLKKMAKAELVHGLPTLEQVEQLCEAYLASKHKRAPFPQQASWHASKTLELLHGDLCGPISPSTPRGNKYFLLLVDDYSRYMWIAVIASKDLAAAEIKRIQAATERKSSNLICALRIEQGEFTASHFREYCEEFGVTRELTAPYTPQ
jgi:hypothetical protein